MSASLIACKEVVTLKDETHLETLCSGMRNVITVLYLIDTNKTPSLMTPYLFYLFLLSLTTAPPCVLACNPLHGSPSTIVCLAGGIHVGLALAAAVSVVVPCSSLIPALASQDVRQGFAALAGLGAASTWLMLLGLSRVPYLLSPSTQAY